MADKPRRPPLSVRSLRKRRQAVRRRWIVGLALAAAASWWWFTREPDPIQTALGTGAGTLSADADRFAPVARGQFKITVLVEGLLDAIKRHDLRVMARELGGAPLVVTNIVENNSAVRAGEVVVEFQKDRYVERVEEIDRQLEQNNLEITLATDDLNMQKAQNLADIKGSTDNLWNNEDALEKYVDLEAPKTRRDLQGAISDAQLAVDNAAVELADAQAALAKARAEGGSVAAQENTVKNKTKALESAQNSLQAANHNNRVWRQYDYPQRLRSLEAAVERSKLDLKRVQTNAGSRIFQFETRLSNHRATRRRLTTERNAFLEDIKNLVLYAPVAGIVNLGDMTRRQWEPKEWIVGTTARMRELCATIPDLSRYMVRCQIPEEQRSKVRVGQQATFSSSAIPELWMTGELTDISPMSTTIDPRDPSSPKVYNTQITADTVDDRLKPGMTMKVEIVVETIENVLFVPVEAVYGRDGKRYALVRAAPGAAMEEREVKPGRSSFDYVEITDGLREGDEVMVVAAGPRIDVKK